MCISASVLCVRARVRAWGMRLFIHVQTRACAYACEGVRERVGLKPMSERSRPTHPEETSRRRQAAARERSPCSAVQAPAPAPVVEYTCSAEGRRGEAQSDACVHDASRGLVKRARTSLRHREVKHHQPLAEEDVADQDLHRPHRPIFLKNKFHMVALLIDMRRSNF